MRQPPNLVKDAPPSRAASPPRLDDRQGPTNYLDLYGLSKAPFGSASDQIGYILFGSHRRTFETLVDHLVNGGGLLVIQGSEGIGKTEMLRSAAAVTKDSGVRTIVVSRPPGGRMDLPGLVSALAQTAGQEGAARDPIGHFLNPPRKALLIDDLDLMPDDCVDLLLSLSQTMLNDLRGSVVVLSTTADPASGTASSRMAQIVGLARHTIRLSPLGHAEIRQYIERSLWVSGGTTRRLISSDAMKLIIAQSGGVPGVVDRLMEAAFTAGYARGDSMITAKTVAAAVGPTSPRPRWRDGNQNKAFERATQIVSFGVLVVGALLFLYRGLAGQSHQVALPLTKPLATDAPTFKPSMVKPAEAPAPSQSKLAVPPVNQPPTFSPAETLSPAVIAALIKRGDQSVELGDIAAARLLFQRAADAGSAAAATALGKSYDPNYVSAGGWADRGRAMESYRRGMALGDSHAEELLKGMAPH